VACHLAEGGTGVPPKTLALYGYANPKKERFSPFLFQEFAHYQFMGLVLNRYNLDHVIIGVPGT
jgi:hypothetical protein